MVFKKFRARIIIRLIIITILIGFLMYYVFVTDQNLRSSYFLAFIVLAIIELFWFIDRTNRDLSNFFEAIFENDFTTTFTETRMGGSFNRLYESLNRITKKFHEIGQEREAQYHFLETMLQQVKVGIISFDANGKVIMINDTFKNLTGINFLSDLVTIRKVNPDLYNSLNELKPSQGLQLKINMNGKLLHLSILASIIKVKEQELKLVTIQNIKTEIEAGEVAAWQKLIRVLAHEIMNSVTPITSLSNTLLEILDKEDSKSEKSKFPENFTEGLKAIKNRSEALNRFTEAYQNLTRIPPPKFSQILAREFVSSIVTLLSPEINSRKLRLETAIDPLNHTFIGDTDLLGQAIINLVKNAMDSLSQEDSREKEGVIHITIEKKDEITRVTISDNGSGIPKDRLDQIFVPFYTSRKKGTGIGLALVKQIVQLHDGTIEVDSVQDVKTSFVIEL